MRLFMLTFVLCLFNQTPAQAEKINQAERLEYIVHLLKNPPAEFQAISQTSMTAEGQTLYMGATLQSHKNGKSRYDMLGNEATKDMVQIPGGVSSLRLGKKSYLIDLLGKVRKDKNPETELPYYFISTEAFLHYVSTEALETKPTVRWIEQTAINGVKVKTVEISGVTKAAIAGEPIETKISWLITFGMEGRTKNLVYKFDLIEKMDELDPNDGKVLNSVENMVREEFVLGTLRTSVMDSVFALKKSPLFEIFEEKEEKVEFNKLVK